MSTYFEFVPIELLEIITYFILPNSVSDFLTLFNSRIKNSLLQVKEEYYQNLFKKIIESYLSK